MADVLPLAAAHYQRQQRLSRRVADALTVLWRTVAADLSQSVWDGWLGVQDQAVQVVAVGQYAAASSGLAYVADTVTAQGADPTPLGNIDPRALTGVAADGRPLDSLLSGGVYRTRQLLAQGAPFPEAMTSGLARMVLAASNEVVQAGTSATTARIGVTPAVRGYTRVLSLPSCSRCILLAGKHFAHNAGFQRHPRCDCIHLPDAGALPDVRRSPEATFAAMSPAEQDEVFTKAGAEALRAGADMGRVVNARQSMYVPAGHRNSRGTPTRRTVEDLLEMAGPDRNRFAALLDSAGYFL